MKLKQKQEQLPSVAILLAAYNGMKWIDEQVVSILCQTGVNIEIFISVDVSTDSTYQWCQNLAKLNEQIKILPYGERFGGAAKNFFRLIKEVDFESYDYVSLADQDDIWLPNKLSHAIKTIKHREVSALSSDLTAFRGDGRRFLIKKSQPQKKLDHFFEAAGPGCTYVFRSDALQKFKVFLISNWGLVNKITFHDWMLYAYFRENEMRWHIDSEALILYRLHESNQIGANLGFQAYRKRLLMVKSGWYRKQVEGIQALVNPNLSLNRFFLIKNFFQLRRKFRDAVVLFFILALGFKAKKSLKDMNETDS
jgi:rhamnosyltransferase